MLRFVEGRWSWKVIKERGSVLDDGVYGHTAVSYDRFMLVFGG